MRKCACIRPRTHEETCPMKTVRGPFSSDMSPGSFWSDVCTHHQTKIPADRERGDVEDTDVLKHGSAMLPRMRQINSTHARDFGTLVTRHNQRTCPIRCTNHRTCPTDIFPADKFLSLLRNFCPLETCPLGRTHGRTCPRKLVDCVYAA